MILSEDTLVEAWTSGRIRFDPDITRKQIRYSSIDLRLGYIIRYPVARVDLIIDLDKKFDPDDISCVRDYSDGTPLILEPGQFVIGQTREYLCMPNNLAGRVEGRSRYARFGLTVHNTAPHLHPKWEGNISLEIINHGLTRARLSPGETLICQVIFHELSGLLKKGYGERPEDIWQKQREPWTPKYPESAEV